MPPWAAEPPLELEPLPEVPPDPDECPPLELEPLLDVPPDPDDCTPLDPELPPEPLLTELLLDEPPLVEPLPPEPAPLLPKPPLPPELEDEPHAIAPATAASRATGSTARKKAGRIGFTEVSSSRKRRMEIRKGDPHLTPSPPHCKALYARLRNWALAIAVSSIVFNRASFFEAQGGPERAHWPTTVPYGPALGSPVSAYHADA